MQSKSIDAYGYDSILPTCMADLHIGVGFLLFYLNYKVMRRPQIVNKQLEVSAFFVSVGELKIYLMFNFLIFNVS